jgi:hypothetical protein
MYVLCVCGDSRQHSPQPGSVHAVMPSSILHNHSLQSKNPGLAFSTAILYNPGFPLPLSVCDHILTIELVYIENRVGILIIRVGISNLNSTLVY